MTSAQRYDRQIRHWGSTKQQQLEQASVLVAGLGGLGGTLCQLLVRAGVGTLYLIDDGRVDWPDLNRQTIYTEQDIDQPKTVCACRYLAMINHQARLIPLNQRIASDFNCPPDVTLIADCLDNYDSRFHLEAALESGAFLVHGAVEGDQGQVVTLNIGSSQKLAELFVGAQQPQGNIPVTGASATLVAALMCQEIYQVIFTTPALLNRFLIVSLADYHLSFLEI